MRKVIMIGCDLHSKTMLLKIGEVRHDQQEQQAYHRIVERNPKKKKIAVVASMRRLAVRMWHRGRAFQGKPSRHMILAAEAAG